MMTDPMKRLKLSLNDLDDGLLVEILHRLPTSKFANRCKLVSRRWNSLISTPYYVARFVERRMINQNTADSTNLYEQELSSTVIITCLGQYVVGQQLRYRYDCGSLSSGYKFPSLPGHDKNYIRILASCNDLVLFWLYVSNAYLVCNPITKQCVALPSPPLKNRSPDFFGLVSTEPYIKISNERGRRTIAVNDRCRFRVVLLIHKTGTDLPQVETYCSETGQWNESDLPTSESWPSADNIVVYKGKLHWPSFQDIVVYDPDDVGQVRMIRAPALSCELAKVWPWMTCLGVSEGALRLMSMTRGSVIIWELEDDDEGEWSLKHRLKLKRLVWEDSCTQGCVDATSACPLAFHPTNKNIVFLGFGCHPVITCDILRGTLHASDKLENEPYSTNCFMVFPLVPPLWPTPIPTLKN